jgi:predicted permease
MHAVTTVALPVFALVLTGVGARRLRIVDEASVVGLNAFVYWFALPALLLVRMADMPITQLFDWRLPAAWSTGGLAIFVVAMAATRLMFGHDLARQAIAGLTASFGHVGYMGLSLTLSAFGTQATLPAVLILASDVIITVSIGVALLEVGTRPGGNAAAVLLTIGGGLGRNPLVLATLGGAALSVAGLVLPAPLMAFGNLLGAAALPCALFALGGALTGHAVAARRSEVGLLVALKLLGHPAAVWVAADLMLGLDPLWTRIAVLSAALPTAATVFVLAQRYDVAIAETSQAALFSVLVGILTVSLVLALLTGT